MSFFKRKQSVEDLLNDIQKEITPTNWGRVCLCLFFGTLVLDACLMQFDSVHAGVNGIVFGMVVSFGFLYFENRNPKKNPLIKEDDISETPSIKIWPYTHPALKNRACPMCGTLNDENLFGVGHVPVSCDKYCSTNIYAPRTCEVKAPHLHASCLSCKSNFLTERYKPVVTANKQSSKKQ